MYSSERRNRRPSLLDSTLLHVFPLLLFSYELQNSQVRENSCTDADIDREYSASIFSLMMAARQAFQNRIVFEDRTKAHNEVQVP